MSAPPQQKIERDQQDVQRAIELAGELLQRAVKLQTPQERRQQAELDRLIGHQEDKATLVEMTDQAFRTHNSSRVADQLTHVLDVQGIPRFFSPVEHAMLRGFQSFGEYLPGVAVPLVKEKMRRETANVILPAEPNLLAPHLRRRQEHGVQMNVNLLGEALLGEDETRHRMQAYLQALQMPQLRCLSVKISTLSSQISPIAREHTIRMVSDRLETLYRNAIDIDEENPKFIYLDMEEFQDLYLTADILCMTLDREGLERSRAGIALQAYVPDSYHVGKRLIEWSEQRVRRGGEPITIRLVKGANMEMERVEASIAGVMQAPFLHKRETDANFKCMLRDLLNAAARGIVRVGIASHNLFDVALAMIWSDSLAETSEVDLDEFIQYEMLEGMANHQRRAISQDVRQRMLLYAPACRQEDFLYAIGYLIRRLDENTGPNNFLRHTYRLRVGTPEFDKLADDFRQSYELMDKLSVAPQRDQDRRVEPVQPPAAEDWSQYVNEPDTDWPLPHNADWIQAILEQWVDRCDDAAEEVPLRIGGETVEDHAGIASSHDPSRPGVVTCRYAKATADQVSRAVDLAVADRSGWRQRPVEQRHETLREVAQNLRLRRGDLIAAMMADGGKTVAESDPEISEAIDFCEFYPLTVRYWSDQPTIQVSGRGVAAVITPWNFPLAIACGGIAGALAAGNTVILKPAPEVMLPAWLLCQAFWDAGMPADTLQMIPCDNEVAESSLVKNPLVDTVLFTGGTATAKRILTARPGVHLLAETGGKNATIVTAMADRDLAIKHVVQSAFGHSGQKCSATSLLLLEDEIFKDKHFREALADAVRSLPVGSAWDLPTRVGPLIREPTPQLKHAINVLDDDESWLVVPEHVPENPNLYHPGVKWNVRPGSFTHCTELFGPVLGVMRFSKLEEAIEIVRATGYGLTSGLESLDDREIEVWKDSIGAGNLYINRSTTGAIVLRQPFGGVGLSSSGMGTKAGGPHYVVPLMHITDADQDAAAPNTAVEKPAEQESTATSDLREISPMPVADHWEAWMTAVQAAKSGSNGAPFSKEDEAAIRRAFASQQLAEQVEFSKEHDSLRLIGQDNQRRYRSVPGLMLRVTPEDSLRDAVVALSAAISVGTQVTLSIDPDAPAVLRQTLESAADYMPGLIDPVEQDQATLAARVRDGRVQRLRMLAPHMLTDDVQEACVDKFVSIVADPVVLEGRIECLRYLFEQSICHSYHRYGNLGRRADEVRRGFNPPTQTPASTPGHQSTPEQA